MLYYSVSLDIQNEGNINTFIVIMVIVTRSPQAIPPGPTSIRLTRVLYTCAITIFTPSYKSSSNRTMQVYSSRVNSPNPLKGRVDVELI